MFNTLGPHKLCIAPIKLPCTRRLHIETRYPAPQYIPLWPALCAHAQFQMASEVFVKAHSNTCTRTCNRRIAEMSNMGCNTSWGLASAMQGELQPFSTSTTLTFSRAGDAAAVRSCTTIKENFAHLKGCRSKHDNQHRCTGVSMKDTGKMFCMVHYHRS
jgi:hypothetical protein